MFYSGGRLLKTKLCDYNLRVFSFFFFCKLGTTIQLFYFYFWLVLNFKVEKKSMHEAKEDRKRWILNKLNREGRGLLRFIWFAFYTIVYCSRLSTRCHLANSFINPFFCCCHPFGLVTPTFIVKISRSNKEITKPPPYHMCMNFRVLKSSLDASRENIEITSWFRSLGL